MSGEPVLTILCYSFSVGGSERIAAAVAKRCSGRGVDTTVCATHGGPGPISAELEEAGIRWLALTPGGGGRIGARTRLFRHLKATGTTVVHVHHLNMLAFAYLPVRLAGVERIVVTEHSVHQLRRSRRVRRRATRNARRADLVTVVHRGLARYLSHHGVPPARLRVIPNGVDTEVYAPGAGRRLFAELDLPTDRVLMASVGRLHPDKDPVNLLRAVSQMSPADRALLHVVLIGDGPLRGELEGLIEELALSHEVTLLGERQDVNRLLGEFDAFVLPSRTEGLPVALLEAMSCGLPVVATSVGGVPAALEQAGILVPAGDPRALADAMLRLARDPDLRRSLGAGGRRRALEEYDRRLMFERYEAALFGELNP